jgi:SAM-dependent methyltransferase
VAKPLSGQPLGRKMQGSQNKMYKQIITSLRKSYNSNAEGRDNFRIEKWKIRERDNYELLLQKENKISILEIGAGTGKDSKYFQEKGFNVICTDLSEEMVRLCRIKGLTAYVMDFMNLDFPEGSFDGIYALNCLLHVPKDYLERVLEEIQKLLKPKGLFYMGVYGGRDSEGIWEEDEYEPKRYFSFYTDKQLQEKVSNYYGIEYFQVINIEDNRDLHFQSIILRRK